MASESREVRQRIDTLYTQAENATGNFNATRAMSAGTRSRGVPLAKRRGSRPDPGLEEMTRQWFDAARARTGPTVAAALPADRMPDGARGLARGGSSRGEWASGARALPELTAGSERAVAELLGLPTAEPAARPVPELTRGPVAELTSGPVAELTGATPELPAGRTVAALPAAPEPPRALPAASGAEPDRRSPATSKSRNQRKLTAARDLLSRRATQQSVPLAAVPAAPTQDAWPATEVPGQQQSDDEWRRQLQWALPGGGTTAGAALPPAVADTSLGAVPAPPSGTATAAPGTIAPWPGAMTAPAGGADPLPPVTAQPTAAPSFDTAAQSLAFPATADPYLGAIPTPPTTTQPSLGAAPTVPAEAAPATVDPYLGAIPAPPTTTHPSLGAAPAPAGIADPFGPGAITDTGSFVAPAVASVTAVAPEAAYAARAAKAVEFARAQVGRPCVWGATGPDSYDCSSLTQAAWKAAGVTLPRAAAQQALAGTPVTLAGIEAGDIVLFFDNDSHVGLYTGNGLMIHAPGPGAFIREESVYGAGESAIHRVIRPA
ncbi:NlpC/P60 family protein [Streptomyces sp. NPDC006739]|uniref:C40 family peptidase n=1 Tax=Streptomyces sp. NPDC006739 TaxID=3364763 RepID=UPI00369366D2